MTFPATERINSLGKQKLNSRVPSWEIKSGEEIDKQNLYEDNLLEVSLLLFSKAFREEETASYCDGISVTK
jgi:hypothetical protein